MMRTLSLLAFGIGAIAAPVAAPEDSISSAQKSVAMKTIETYCSEATIFSHKGVTYTVPTPGTFTFTATKIKIKSNSKTEANAEAAQTPSKARGQKTVENGGKITMKVHTVTTSCTQPKTFSKHGEIFTVTKPGLFTYSYTMTSKTEVKHKMTSPVNSWNLGGKKGIAPASDTEANAEVTKTTKVHTDSTFFAQPTIFTKHGATLTATKPGWFTYSYTTTESHKTKAKPESTSFASSSQFGGKKEMSTSDMTPTSLPILFTGTGRTVVTVDTISSNSSGATESSVPLASETPMTTLITTGSSSGSSSTGISSSLVESSHLFSSTPTTPVSPSSTPVSPETNVPVSSSSSSALSSEGYKSSTSRGPITNGQPSPYDLLSSSSPFSSIEASLVVTIPISMVSVASAHSSSKSASIPQPQTTEQSPSSSSFSSGLSVSTLSSSSSFDISPVLTSSAFSDTSSSLSSTGSTFSVAGSVSTNSNASVLPLSKPTNSLPQTSVQSNVYNSPSSVEILPVLTSSSSSAISFPSSIILSSSIPETFTEQASSSVISASTKLPSVSSVPLVEAPSSSSASTEAAPVVTASVSSTTQLAPYNLPSSVPSSLSSSTNVSPASASSVSSEGASGIVESSISSVKPMTSSAALQFSSSTSSYSSVSSSTIGSVDVSPVFSISASGSSIPTNSVPHSSSTWPTSAGSTPGASIFQSATSSHSQTTEAPSPYNFLTGPGSTSSTLVAPIATQTPSSSAGGWVLPTTLSTVVQPIPTSTISDVYSNGEKKQMSATTPASSQQTNDIYDFGDGKKQEVPKSKTTTAGAGKATPPPGGSYNILAGLFNSYN